MSNKYTDEFFKEYEQKYSLSTNEPEVLPPQSNTVSNHSSGGKHSKRRKHRVLPFALLCVMVAVAVVVMVCIGSAISKIGTTDNGSQDAANSVLEPKPEEPKVDKTVPLPTFTDATQSIGGNVDSEYAVFVNLTDNTVVADKNSNTKIYPASLTKILTLLVAVENIEDFDDTFIMTIEITDAAFEEGASVAGFVPDEVITVNDLLYGAILPSGADATAAIAQYVAGSEQEFVKLMNAKVNELGITTAHFMNTSGLHHEDHYCTVMDIVRILRAAMENEKCKEILATYQYTTSVTPQHPNGILLTSTMFSRMYGTEPEGAVIKGGKTGFTNEAGNCLASFGIGESGDEYIFVTTNAHGKYAHIFDHIHSYTRYAD